MDPSFRSEASKVDGSIQRIAAKILLHGAEELAAELNHTFAEEGDAGGFIHVSCGNAFCPCGTPRAGNDLGVLTPVTMALSPQAP
ncbi:hypothetical protein GCM10008941_06960 [Rhizomicrobium palustre]